MMQNPKLQTVEEAPAWLSAAQRRREHGTGGGSSLLRSHTCGFSVSAFLDPCYSRINSNEELLDLWAWSSGYF